jgi:hypothetical protein
MTKSSEDVVKLAHKLDGLKKFIGAIKERSTHQAFQDEDFSLFPLYMAFSKHVDSDVLEYEPESVRKIVGNDSNGDRINTVISTTARGDVWTNPIAFDMFVDASTGREINPSLLSPDYAEELIFGMINIAGIEGAIAMPFKTHVLNFIKACLDHDGWDVPPLPLFFKNITDLYDQEDIERTKKSFGNMSLNDIYSFDNKKMLDKEHPSTVNYFLRNQEVAAYVISKYEKLMFDWTTLINGD